MQLIFENTKKRTITGKEEIAFSGFSSYYLIAVTARAKSAKQLSDNATDDEDLIVKIDNKSFPHLSPKQTRFIDSPGAFSGGRLHNHSKTVYYLTFLKGRYHTIALETDKDPHTAVFESLSAYVLDLTESIEVDVYNQAEDGDRRPWIVFVFDNLSLHSITPIIIYSRRKRDSDDVKIKIDGKTQGNIVRNIKHFLWRVVGSLLQLGSPTKTEIETFTVNLPQGLHYIEFDADRMPILDALTIHFGEKPSLPEGIPTVDKPTWTGSFYDDTEVLLLARAIYGEAGGESKDAKLAIGWAIRNRLEDKEKRWGKTYHDVILQPFQYEPFNKTGSDRFDKITDPQLDNPLEKRTWYDSCEAAENVILDKTKDPVSGANHFYSTDSLTKPPWASEEKFVTQTEKTRFYKL